MITEEKKLWAVELLQNKCKELGGLPKKDDFVVVTVSRIKAFLGPWPRALEAAGLKEVTKIPKKPKSRRKALNAKVSHQRALRKLEKKRTENKKNDVCF